RGTQGHRQLHAASRAHEPRNSLDDLRARAQDLSPRPARDPVEILRGGAVRACLAVRRNAGNPPCARLQHDVHRGGKGPRRGPRHHRLGARQPYQGRLRPGGSEHEPHARLSRDPGARAGGAVSVTAAPAQCCKIFDKKTCARSLRGLPKNSAVGASSTIWPLSMNTTRWATLRAKPISCVTTIMVMPSLASATMTSSTSLIISGSS